MKHKTIAVIGLGQFGGTVAKMLASMDHEVLGVDIDPEVVQKISPFITHAIVADTTDEEAIKALALSQFDIVIVAIGDNIQGNLMTSMLLKEMNMPYVVSKAENALQGKMLKKMGVDKVIYPEYDVAQRLAQSLTRDHVMDYLQLSKNISLIEIKVPTFLVGANLKDSNLREKYNLNAVGIRRGEDLEVPPNPITILGEDDKLLVIGNNSDLDALTM